MSREVTLAGQKHTVEGPTAFKFELIGDRLKALMARVPGVDEKWAQKVKEHRETHFETLGRATAQYTLGGPPTTNEGVPLVDLEGKPLPGMLDHITEKDWEMEKGPDGQPAPHTITRRFNPSGNAEMAFYFDEFYTMAKEDLIDILAVVITPNTDLENAECEPPEGVSGTDQVQKVIGEKHRLLRFRADFGELYDIFLAVVDEVVETIELRRDKAGNLQRAWNMTRPKQPDLKVIPGGQDSEPDSTQPKPDEPTPSSRSTQPSTQEQIPSPSNGAKESGSTHEQPPAQIHSERSPESPAKPDEIPTPG